MSGVLRLGNTGAGTGRSTVVASASNDQTFTLPSAGGTLLTSNYSAVGTITLDGSTVNITNGDLNVDSGTLFVDESTNQVGIGTTSPATILSAGTGSGTNAITINGAASSTSKSQLIFHGGGTNNPSAALEYDAADAGLAFQVGNYSTLGSSEQMRILANGNTGIGDSSPDARCVVYRQTQFAGNTIFSVKSDAGSTKSTKFMVDGDGSVGMGTASPQHGLSLVQGNALGWVSSVGNAKQKIEATGTDGLDFYTGSTPSIKVTIDSSGRLLLNSGTDVRIELGTTGTTGTNNRNHLRGDGSNLKFNCCSGGVHVFEQNGTEHVRISSVGDLTTTGASSFNRTNIGFTARKGDSVSVTRNGGTPLEVNRGTNDGNLVNFFSQNTVVGTISNSGSTVSYNGGHLARWSQLTSGAGRIEILRGSVLSNLNEMCEWGDEDNEQLNRMKVSDVEGDRNVAGVFQSWDDDDDTYTNDFYCAMTGDFIIRIAQGTTVARGDLLMSAGDGTAKPQDDDIVRSKTIAKVTSTTVSETYSDGSYCVPCVLMAC